MIKIYKKTAIILTLIILFGTLLTSKDNNLPSVKIKDINGNTIDTKTLNNDGKPFVIMFWATWCKPCLIEMKAVHENYEDWQNEYGIKIYAVSIDDSRNSHKVAPFAKGRGWKFNILIDENQDFKRAMNVNNPPHTFIIDSKGNIAWQHNGYAPGDEDEMIKQYKKLIK